MYVQVGIGNGNASDTIQGGYDYWFLPQKEDQMGAKPVIRTTTSNTGRCSRPPHRASR